jgi:polar amino acid transport system substrate-binding protein
MTSAAIMAAALVLTGCGKSTNTTTTPTPSPTETTSGEPTTPAANTPADMLPADIKSAGVIRVASDIAYAPVEFYEADGKTVTGFDYDLAMALGKVLGVKFEFTNVGFDGIIAALKAGKHDIIMSAMTDNAERQKTLDFVDYYQAGTSIVVAKGNPQGITDFSDLCGKTVAVEKGTIQVEIAETESKNCTDAGKPAMKINQLPKDTDALAQVASGKAVADFNDSPVAAYIVQQSEGKFESVLSKAEGTAPYGIGVLKGKDDLTKAIQAALKEVIASGEYDKIVAKWGMEDGAYKDATINAGT